MRLLGSLLAVCCLSLLFLAPTSAHADLVTNGNFAAGSAGWTYNPSSSFPWAFENNGTYSFASTGCVGPQCITGTTAQQAYLFQNLTTVAGDTYTLSFAYTPAAGTPTELLVLFGGTSADDLVNVAFTGSLVTYTVSGLVASSSSTELEFLGRQDPSFDQLTDVSVNLGSGIPAPTPEPGTMGMVGTGLLSLFGVARRRFC